MTKQFSPKEYRDNPFIECLPPVRDSRSLNSVLEDQPYFDEIEIERQQHANIRRHCLYRLKSYYQPLSMSLRLAESIDAAIKQGYVHRNPNDKSYLNSMRLAHERKKLGILEDIHQPLLKSMFSMSLIGCSGLGKTHTVHQILGQYTQVVMHDFKSSNGSQEVLGHPMTVYQLVWLKLECPSSGGIEQLAINFFSMIDTLLGTSYLKTHYRKNKSRSFLRANMALVATIHAIGLLVIDEIQHFNQAENDRDNIDDFLVELVNTLGIPVLIIGTMAALPLLQRTLREARRATDLGSQIWENMHPGAEWDYLVNKLWRFQWTTEVTPLTDDLKVALYDETQGIPDFLIKLFMLCQLRLMNISDGRKIQEIITVDLIRQVAKSHFRIIEPMLNALRVKDETALLHYEDLRPLASIVAAAFRDAANTAKVIVPSQVIIPDLPADEALNVRSSLKALGVEDAVIQATLTKIMRKDSNQDMKALARAALVDLFGNESTKTRQPKLLPSEVKPMPVFDLRRVLAESREDGVNLLDALVAAKLVRNPLEDSFV